MSNNAALQIRSEPDFRNFDSMLLPSYQFTTADFSPCDQFDAFQQEFSAAGRPHFLPGKQARDGFFAKRTGYYLHGLRFVISETESYAFSNASKPSSGVAGGHWVLVLRLNGHAEIGDEGQRVRYEGHKLEFRHHEEGRTGYVSDNETLFLYLPREQFQGMEFLLDRLADADSTPLVHPLLGCYLMALARVLPTLRRSNTATVADATMSMVRAGISYAPDMADAAKLPIMMTRFEMARNYIENNLKSPNLNANTIASLLSVSRRQLYKIFESRGGVHNYIRTRRLVACFNTISSSQGKCSISAIAEDFGFADVARFSRAFRAEFECSPSELRERAGVAPGPTAFDNWLVTVPPETGSAVISPDSNPFFASFR
ncbi:helix-turn-helix domain-containing protein [Rhizobium halophytocola]|uniref:AraC-like DNA-binding protein n=1 Tax=Rhizobium halophytocola TaxID=735519 RepID=A0ABS4E6K8_9HYPH|nr:helix-turn-helix domain-containing protein [Rhizobium halophytocola]MBP1853582.1 AraC-like DNA-binding protein [Rhizobium halophytocola]